MDFFFSHDPYRMNWFRSDFEYAKVTCPEELTAEVVHETSENRLTTMVRITNHTDRPVFTTARSIGIQIPLEDRYDSSEICMERRCHAHLFCGEDITYICALRMGGEAPHLGMVLTKGSICCYSILRDAKRSSNDRGCFVLHPSPAELLAGESMTLSWTFFAHQGKDDFFRQIALYRPFVRVTAASYVLLPGEKCIINVEASFPVKQVTLEGIPAQAVQKEEKRWTFEYVQPETYQLEPSMLRFSGRIQDDPRERIVDILVTPQEWPEKESSVLEASMEKENSPEIENSFTVVSEENETLKEVSVTKESVPEIHTTLHLIHQQDPMKLAEERCRFIVQRQQYFGRDPHLQGAFLPYDCDEERIFYRKVYDYNAGRERVGMGLLLIEYVKKLRKRMENRQAVIPEDRIVSAFSQGNPFEKQKEERNRRYLARLEQSLASYMDFVKRELVVWETGQVTNGHGYDDSYQRLYNAPWYAQLFVKYCELNGDPSYLAAACRILQYFYDQGGMRFYPLELPVSMLIKALNAAAMEKEREQMLGLFRQHADNLMEIGTHYPPHEVNYEQSIVAPAAWILLQVYEVTGESRYLEAGKKQLDILDLFNGIQPDAHLYETAIRHWDGYWFGKKKLFGDTFPHYWSGLTGNCFNLYAKLDPASVGYEKRAEASLRSVLSLIFPDGKASCACVYPSSVNEVEAGCYDPFANDQDWALYFWLREMEE